MFYKNKRGITILLILVIISLISVINAAFNTEMMITGNAILRVDSDIRITDLKVTSIEANSYETYSSKYTKDTTSMFVTLPEINSTIIYEATITNKSDKVYDIADIIIENKLNSNINYEIVGLEKGKEIAPNSIETFTIKLSYNTTTLPSDTTEELIIKYEFEEHIYPYIVEEYGYSGKYQELIVPHTGIYKLEVWGAEGGTGVIESLSNSGGYGGYSTGEVQLTKGESLYIAVGGEGSNYVGKIAPDLPEELLIGLTPGGFNGGGDSAYSGRGSGGGATSIYRTLIADGQLKNYENNKEEILIVAGGGGGGQVYKANNKTDYSGIGGHGGGYIGGNGTIFSTEVYGYGTGGTQNEGGTAIDVAMSLLVDTISDGSFGLGAFVKGSYKEYYVYSSGGGGGFYGGGAIEHGPAGGGSGYIGNTILSNKYMTCYECTTSSDENTRTNSTTNVSATATSDYAKMGNGYTKITFLKRIYN